MTKAELNNKKVIWGLFDDGTRSYFEALKAFDNVFIVSIGINKKHEENANYKIIDLSITNQNLIKELKKLPPQFNFSFPTVWELECRGQPLLFTF